MKAVASFFTETKNARKIVVVDFGFLGDTVHLVPSLWELRRNYPKAELHVVTTPAGGGILKLLPWVDQVWPYALTNPSPPWYESLGLLRRLRRERFDVLFNFSGADRTLYFSMALGVKNKLTQTPRRWHFFNPLLSRYWAPQADPSVLLPVYIQRHKMLETAGLRVELPKLTLTVPEALMQEAQKWVYPGAIHLSPNTSSYLKEWPAARWAELIRLIAHHYPEQEMVLTCSQNPREIERAQKIVEKASTPTLHVLDKLSIPHLAAVVSQCKLHIGGDSGATHLAWALGLPTLTLYRQYPDMATWVPQGEQHIQLTSKCYCLKSVNPECFLAKESLCLANISAEAVFQKIHSQLQ